MGVQWIHNADSDYFKHCASVLFNNAVNCYDLHNVDVNECHIIMRHWRNDTDRRTQRKTCFSATISTTNPTVGSSPGLRGKRRL